MYVWNEDKGEFEYPTRSDDEAARLEACSETAPWVRQHLDWCDETDVTAAPAAVV